jgi:Family of unknown function (DUF6069)
MTKRTAGRYRVGEISRARCRNARSAFDAQAEAATEAATSLREIQMTAIASRPVRTVRTSGVWKTVAAAALAAAAATEALVALSGAAGNTVAIQGAELKPGGCAVMVVICVAVGAALLAGVRRWASSPARTWVRTTVGLTALSFVPDLAVSDTSTSSRLVLMTAHAVAAAIVIPAVARKLSESR